MAKKAGKQKPKLGAVIAIPLPGDKFAFAKIFKDYNLGIYDLVSDKIEPAESVAKRKMAFFQAATDSAIKSGEWPIIGEEPFADEDSAWAPPKAGGIVPGLPLNPGMIKLAHKGSMRPATLKEVAGLDIDMFCQRPELCVAIIVDRLIKGDHTDYRVPR